MTCMLAIACAISAGAEVRGKSRPIRRWWQPYTGEQVTGKPVLGYWRFDGSGDEFLRDSSAHRRKSTLRGATYVPNGRFGGALQSDVGFPFSRSSHAVHVTDSKGLSPPGPFSAEMWIQLRDLKPEEASLAPVLIDCKYVPDDHRGWMWSLTSGAGETRQLCLELGLDDHSDRWYSEPVPIEPARWYHVAFSYDARGTVRFYVDGSLRGTPHRPNAGSIAESNRPLAIGDRLGSNYRGFPGLIDEACILSGEWDFRPFTVEPRDSLVFLRHAAAPPVRLSVENRTNEAVSHVTMNLLVDGATEERAGVVLARRSDTVIPGHFNTALRPGEYEWSIELSIPDWPEPKREYRSITKLPVSIVARPLPHRLPVVMWGIGGTENVIRELPRLRQLGFTHCLGLRVDYGRIWEEGSRAHVGEEADIRAARRMLDEALRHDVRIIASLSPGRWLRDANVGRPYLRVDRQGRPYSRRDVSGLFPRVQQFCYDVGAAVGRDFGDHPAFDAALLHTEVRGESQVSFHPAEVEAYRRFAGTEPPSEVSNKNGVDYHRLADFPADRVVPDDHPILKYLGWFWTQGDGWNQLHTALHRGLHEHIDRDGFWTFHDPAVRVPSIRGSGGRVDVLSHWTYTYPDPIRIGLCTDELFEMARVNGADQHVMKMTQVIWYRSQTAPQDGKPPAATSPWVDRDPDAAYITIAPQHLREAFWWKLSRPIQGIMYHGWQSLVPTESKSAYRLTNERTRHTLRQLIHDVVQPLGPMLVQVPDVPADVAMLESFTSEMFARRGTYGWNHTWAGDVYHILMYARLQPRVLFEQSVLAGELKKIRVLVLPDCDVLPRSVVDRIAAFQSAGGIVVGDEETCPAIEPDYVLARSRRTGRADEDKAAIQRQAAELRHWLSTRYQWPVDTTSDEVLVRRRNYGTADYVFAVNDRREFGSYVGGYGRVMEDGLPSTARLTLQRSNGYVYDLRRARRLDVEANNGQLSWKVELGPCEGGLWMVTERPIREVEIDVPATAKLGESVTIHVRVTDGEQPVAAVVPVRMRVLDPEGTAGEYSGYYGAAGGMLTQRFDIAPNDRVGLWRIEVTELASGRTANAYIRVERP